MHTTSLSLLMRLKNGDSAPAWDRFAQLYTPLIYYWARRMGLESNDAQDLVQDVFTTLVEKLPAFEYDRQHSFRSWLRTVTLNKFRDRQRKLAASPLDPADASLANLAGFAAADAFEENEYRCHVVARALEVMRSDFHEPTWRACWELVVNDRSAEDMGAELGLSVGAVYAAKFRVLARLRQELGGLLE